MTRLLLLTPLLLAGCLEPAEYQYGTDLDDLEFDLYTDTVGIHPDGSVFDDPNNPFAAGGVDDDMKWQLNDYRNPAAGWYGWATNLAGVPSGEAQYYAGTKLKQLLDFGAAPEDTVFDLRGHAIASFQAVLDHFPESESFLADGATAFALAPLAYQGIVDLGGRPTGGWVQVATPDGGTTVVQVGGESGL